MRLTKKQTLLFFIILSALLVRLYFVFSDRRPLEGDQLWYDKVAMVLATHGEYALEKGRPTAYVTPLYPLFLAGVYAVFGHTPVCAKVAQAFLGAFMCFLVYRISRKIFPDAAALWSAFLTGIYYFFISYTCLLLSENLFMVFVALSVLFLLRLAKTASYRDALAFSLFSGLATLTRSAYFLFPFLAAALLILFAASLHIPPQKRRKIPLAIIVSFCLLVGIWTVRNLLVLGRFIPLGSEAGVVIYTNYNPPQGKIMDKTAQDDVFLQAAKMNEAEQTRFLIKETIRGIRRDPAKLIRYIPLRLAYFFSPFEWVAFSQPGAYNFSYVFILPLALAGVALIFRRIPRHLAVLLFLPLIYFLFVATFLTGVPRTRLPVEPYLIIAAGFFLGRIFARSRSKILPCGIILVWFLANYLLYLNSPLIKAAARQGLRSVGLW